MRPGAPTGLGTVHDWLPENTYMWKLMHDVTT